MTDHTIPPINPSIDPWSVTDTQIDWNDTSKKIVVTGLSLIPDVGEILGPLADLLWPKTQVNVWDQVKNQTEAIVNQAIAASVYTQVSEDLSGLINTINLYQVELKNYNVSVIDYQKDPTKPIPNPNGVLTQWMDTRTAFSNALPHFRSVGNELPLLGMHAQFANLYLALLRDVVINGKDWGRTPNDQSTDITNLQWYITDFINYTTSKHNAAAGFVISFTQPNNHLCEPFRTVNAFERGMTLTVLDYRDTWSYYDVTKYPNGVNVVLNKEIYSDPYGSCDDSGPIKLAGPPTQFPTNLTVWGWDRIDAVQLTYPAGGGPGGVTLTPRMGDQDGGTPQKGGSTQTPHGGIFNLTPNNPITQVRTLYTSYWLQHYLNYYGPVVLGMQLKFNDGTVTDTFGNQNTDTSTRIEDTGMLSYTGRALSSIHINGENKEIGSAADCVVYGFKYWQSPAATLRAIQILYVKSPKERLVADFAKAFPNLIIPADLITNELKGARLAYWAYIEAYAKAHK